METTRREEDFSISSENSDERRREHTEQRDDSGRDQVGEDRREDAIVAEVVGEAREESRDGVDGDEGEGGGDGKEIEERSNPDQRLK